MAESDDARTITVLLNRWHSGDQEAASELMERVYGELHKIAARQMRSEYGGHTLQATAVVHEAFLRLCGPEVVDWQNRGHFYAVAARQMRRVLVDHARQHHSEKRGGDVLKFSLLESDGAAVEIDERLLGVDQALAKLELLDPRAAKGVELRFFGGLNESEAALALGISVATLKRDWEFAKSWLTSELS